jgi:hypothetical protein
MTLILVKFPNATKIDPEQVEKDMELNLKIEGHVKGI